jgi:plasmid stabilization system protein ParE
MREVVLTETATAKEDIEYIASFLKNQFSNRTKIDFLVQLSEKLLFIEKMPFMYPASTKNPIVRKCIVHKNTVCFYEVTDKLVLILTVLDSRINPDDLRF